MSGEFALALFIRELSNDPDRVRRLQRERFPRKTNTNPRCKRATERA